MLNINELILGGRIGNEVEVRTTPNGVAVCTIRVAVNRPKSKGADGNRITDWFSVTAWRNTAEFIGKYARKGDEIVVRGTVNLREYTTKNNETRTELEVQADDVLAINNKAQEPAQASAPATAYGQPTQDFEEVDGDETLPF